MPLLAVFSLGSRFEGNPANNGQGLRAMIFADAALILVEGDIQQPGNGVFDNERNSLFFRPAGDHRPRVLPRCI